MDALLVRHQAARAVFVTAWNPFSRRMPEGWNLRMQARLRARLGQRVCLPAVGALGRWHEDHLLVLAELPPLLRLARRFRQNAVVAVRRGARARLVLLSRPGAS